MSTEPTPPSDPVTSNVPPAPASSSMPPSATTPPPPPVAPPAAPASATPTPRSNVTGTDKIWALLCHLSTFIGVPFILPLVVYLAMKDESEYVTHNAREALNFHLSILIYGLAFALLALIAIGIPLLILLGLASLVFSIIAAIKASDGGCYVYPLTIRLVK